MSLGRRAQSGMNTPSRETAAKAEEARVAEAAKTTRLRALRLAKEAADRDAMPRVPPPPRIHRAVRPRRADDSP
jgi:hypothetical protein